MKLSHGRSALKVFSPLILFFLLSGCAAKQDIKSPEQPPAPVPSTQARPFEVTPGIEEQWGIQILPIRLTASGFMIDFRYRVKDPEKAQAITRRQIETYLIDQATGTKCAVPRTNVGPLRGTAAKPIADRNYVVLFSNPGQVVKSGSKVTVVIGDFKVENLVVE